VATKAGRGLGRSAVAFQEGEGLRFHQARLRKRTSLHMLKGTTFRRFGK
jgi:hypothetical protein